MAAPKAVLWAPEALRDLDDAWDHVAQEASINAAERVLRSIESSVARLSEWPLSGRARDELIAGLRSIPAEPYVIFYRARPHGIDIVRVLHGRRDIDAIFSQS